MTAEDVSAEIHGFSEPDSTPLPWAVGCEQVRAADTFWLSTVRPDGRPHVTPLLPVHAVGHRLTGGAGSQRQQGPASRREADTWQPVRIPVVRRFPRASRAVAPRT